MRADAEDLLLRLQADLGNRYRVEREFRTGGMATVYLGTDLNYHRRVAIKLLRPELAAAVGQRFLQEIAFIARLNHPHILPLYDSGAAAGSLFYVMPFVPEESLCERLSREKQLPVSEALRIAREIADALAYAHANGIVHRDIKPANILLSAGHAIVADFGIARALNPGNEAISSEGLVIGTPAYMSPEQATGSPDGVDARSDIYSLSCVLYEMLAGTPPFSAATAQAVLARHQFDPVPPLRTVRANVPEHIEAALLRGLAKVPADRYPTATSFNAALSKPKGRSSRFSRTSRRRLRWAMALGGTLVVVGMVVHRRLERARTSALDPYRVVVYPFTAAIHSSEGQLMGEDVATAIVAALNNTQLVSGINGWRLLGEEQRSSSPTSLATARELALRSSAQFYLEGRLVAGDSMRAVLELHDLRGDSSRQRTVAFQSADDAWNVGVTIARDVLPLVLGREAALDLRALGSPNPSATAAYLFGDRAYRRGQFLEASKYFRRAVDADSTFAIASVMGAQAAGWARQKTEAVELLRVALTHRRTLGPRYLHYVEGLHASWLGLADSAIRHLRKAIDLDPGWPEAWAELGEVYSHWLPNEPEADSLQADSFRQAVSHDPAFVPALFHLVEISLRQGAWAEAERLMKTMVTAGADSTDLIAIELMLRCVRSGPRLINWAKEVRQHPADVADVGSALTAAGLRQPRCAEAAWSGLMLHDQTTSPNAVERRYRALVGLHALLIAEQRYQQAEYLLDQETRVSRLRVWPLRIVAAMAGAPQDGRTDAAADSLAATANLPAAGLWSLAIWKHHRRDTLALAGLRQRAIARVQSPRATRLDTLLAESLEGWVALAHRDTVGALQQFRRLAPLGGDDHLESLCVERMTLAQLYLSQKDYVNAFRTAKLMDAPAGVSYAIYLPASLKLRAGAARGMGDEHLARHMEGRNKSLRQGEPKL